MKSLFKTMISIIKSLFHPLRTTYIRRSTSEILYHKKNKKEE